MTPREFVKKWRAVCASSVIPRHPASGLRRYAASFLCSASLF